MRLTRVFVQQKLVSGKGVGIPEQSGLHLTRVLRLDAGAPVTLFDGTGGEYAATLQRDGKQIWARVGEFAAAERESSLDITLLQGIARGERMDLIVQKSTELGVNRIVPVFAERSVVKADAKQRERKREHWQAVAIAACEQCGRNRVPVVHAVQPLAAWLAAQQTAGLVLSLRPGTLPLAAVQPSVSTTLLSGPEGGLAPAEEDAALQRGWQPVQLGPRVLRAETAPLAALAVLTLAGTLA